MNAVRKGLGNGLVQAFLVVIGLVWLTPLAGLFVSSMGRPRTRRRAAGGRRWPPPGSCPSTTTRRC